MQILTKSDEEFQMLLEVAEEYGRQKEEKTSHKKSGSATEIVIRNHLLKAGFNVTLNPNVRILGSNRKIDSLLLEPSVNPNKLEYAPDEVDVIIEIKNNAVANQSKIIRQYFEELKNVTENFRFAVIVLSERKNYTHEITEEKLADKKFRVFTLIYRKRYPTGGLYRRSSIIEMMNKYEIIKTGKWKELLDYLEQRKT